MSAAQAHRAFPAQQIIQFRTALAHGHVLAALISATESAILAPITALPVLAPPLAVNASTLPLFS